MGAWLSLWGVKGVDGVMEMGTLTSDRRVEVLHLRLFACDQQSW